MTTLWRSWTVVCVALSLPVVAGAQAPVGALAIDERQGDRYGWAGDFDSSSSARSAALGEVAARGVRWC